MRFRLSLWSSQIIMRHLKKSESSSEVEHDDDDAAYDTQEVSVRVSLYHLGLAFLCSACSLSIDTTPDGLNRARERNAGEEIAGEMTSGEMIAGEVMAGEVTAGEVTAGEMIAGEMIAGEMIAGEGTIDTPHPLGGLRSQSASGDPRSGRPSNLLSEALADQHQEDLTLRSFLGPFLPSPDCLVYDRLTDVCLVTIDRDDFSVCSDWQQNYPMRALTSWTGDRSTCDPGAYEVASIEDFKRALNLYRRQLRLPEVEINLTEDAQNCALAYDVLYRDQRPSFEEGTPCYTEAIVNSLNVAHNIILGSWSPYAHLHKLMGLSSFDGMPLAQKVNFRHSLLIAQATEIMLGGRGYTMCFRSEVEESIASPQVLTYPAPGLNPYTIVNPANHESGVIPWSVGISGEVNDLALSLTTIKGDGTRADVELNEVSETPVAELQRLDMKLFGFTFVSKPRRDVAYELNIQWRDATEARHVQVMIGFKDCGFSQLADCDLFPDTCVVPGTRCAPFSNDDGALRHCVFSGPLERGDLCDRLGTESCQSGVCISVNDSDTMCGSICDPDAAQGLDTACDQLCPSGTNNFLGLQVCQ